MIVHVLSGVTALCYAVSSGLYILFLAKGTDGSAKWAARVCTAAVIGHCGYLMSDWLLAGRLPTLDIHQALGVMSLLLVLVFLVMGRVQPRLRVLGTFITPVALLLFLGAAVRAASERNDVVPEGVLSALLPIHITVNVLGLAAFAVAFAAAIAYVIQERQLRKKQLGGLFQRLPALGTLDILGLRSVMVGFPLLTVGVVTGTFWVVKASPGAIGFSTSQSFGLLAWLLFAAVLLLRVAAGWRGRKAAIGTMLGFLCTVFVLVGYVVRGSGEVG